MRQYSNEPLLNRPNLIEVMAHGQVCNKHPLETRHMPGNERQPVACSINRRGLSDDEREKSHNRRHKFIYTAYVSHTLTSDATFSTKIALNPGQIRYSFFLNQGFPPISMTHLKILGAIRVTMKWGTHWGLTKQLEPPQKLQSPARLSTRGLCTPVLNTKCVLKNDCNYCPDDKWKDLNMTNTHQVMSGHK